MIRENAYFWPVTIEFEDVDGYGIAHHSKLINFLERARVHFFAEAGVDLLNSEFSLVMVQMSIDFLKPMKILEQAEVKLQVKKCERASLTWEYSIVRGEDKLLKSNILQASVDRVSLRPRRIPEEIQKELRKIQI